MHENPRRLHAIRLAASRAFRQLARRAPTYRAACAFILIASACWPSPPATSRAAAARSERSGGARRTGRQGRRPQTKGKPAPDAVFNDPDGGTIRLADFKGKPVLVNLWATWCAPCVKELPTLDRLARGEDGVRVIAVSQDDGAARLGGRVPQRAPDRDLEPYQDPKMGLSGALGADRCCRPRSCSTPTARKSGATSATSTGRARRRLDYCRKPAAAQASAEQPAVDRREAERDQREADEILRRERLAQEQPAEQDRDGRNQQGDEERVGRARSRRSAGNRAHSRRRCRTAPARRSRPTRVSGGKAWVHGWSTIIDSGSMISAPAVSWPVVTLSGEMPMRAETARPDGGKRIAQRGGDAGELGKRAGAEARQQRRADHRRDSAEAEQHAGELARVHPLVVGKEVGDDHAPDRRGRIEDRGKAAGDMRLAPAEKANGSALLSKASRRIEPHTSRGRPTLCRLKRRNSHIAAAAMVSRSQT